ncbi:matE family protein [Clostridioides difficile CD160]|nr:matE family protein [Clostridioides difficile CD160]
MGTKIDFISGDTKKCLVKMSLPLIIAMFLNMAYNLVDSIWIGNLLGETAMAALTTSTPIILIITSIAIGATNGISILISQSIGAKEDRKIESLISTSLLTSVIFALIVTVISELSLPFLLRILNTPTETYSLAYSYF